MGVLTKYDQIELIYLPQSIVTYIYLHPVYIVTSNMSVIYGFWILYLDLLDKSSGGITINYNTLKLIVSTLR
jgi:hypothetical protein